MSWVLVGHAYSNWMGGIFVNNPNVSSDRNQKEILTNNTTEVVFSHVTVTKFGTSIRIFLTVVVHILVGARRIRRSVQRLAKR